MAATVRIGVVGTGIGTEHVRVFQDTPHARVVAVCSAQRQRAESAAHRFDVPLATDDYRDLLGPEVDALVVATPPALHAPITLDAVAAGKHVFVEKPLAASLDEARAMRDAARAAGVVHMVNFQLRFAAVFARAKVLVDEGYLGGLAIADARMSLNPVDYLRSSEWSTSKADWFTDVARRGGFLGSSAGPHLADLLLWLGGPIAAVAARTAVTRPTVTLAGGETVAVAAEDAFLILVHFASGALGTLRGVPIAHHRGQWALELDGLAGTLIARNDVLLAATAADREPEAVALPEEVPHDREVIAGRFVEAIRAGAPSPEPSFADGFAAQALLEAAMTAARSGRWVDVEQV
ncbi:MAG TPA: Gfo/Idh/MocA family oxidoreductase [Thermomicrobiaceae bacterium]|nr:Gfo/Idh/MocA family oxidoreductase [Thermomicrobiaceae bacterium]